MRLQLSVRERDRVALLRAVSEGLLSVRAAAERARLSVRQFRRLLRRYEEEGDAAVIHRSRGQPSNHRKPEAQRQGVLEQASQPVYHDFGPTLLAEHLSRDPKIGQVHASTLRLWMIEAGLWEARPRKLRHRKRRDRRAACGELVQMDTSIHGWLEDRSDEEIVLISMLDDATSWLFARFVPRDTGRANRAVIRDYLLTHGRPQALYVDQAGHFRNRRRTHRRDVPAEEREAELTRSIIFRALQALDCEMITAYSPQAKGRVERLFGTLQDRLLKEMRVRDLSSLAEADRFLQEEFIPFWNERFTVAPAEPVDAHRPLPDDVDLEALFADTETRKITRDFTLRFKNQRYQVSRAQAHPAMPGSEILVEQRLDGSLHFRWREQYLDLEPAERSEDCWAAQQRKAEAEARKSTNRKPRPLPPKPPADSPLRQFHSVSKRAATLRRERELQRKKMAS